MVYLIYGNCDYLINKEIFKIINEESYIVFNTEAINFNIDDLLTTINSNSLFYDNKIIIIKNYFGLYDSKYNNEKIIKILEGNINKELLFVNEKIDKKVQFYKFLSQHSNVIECVISNKYDYVKRCEQYLKECTITLDNVTKNELINKSNMNFDLFVNNINNVVLFNEKLTINSLKQITSYNDEVDIFLLINAIIEKKEDCIKLFMHTKQNIEIIQLLYLISSELRLIYNVKYIKKHNKNNKEIQDELKINNEYRLTKILEKTNNYSLDVILKLLDDISNIFKSSRLNNIPIDIQFLLWLTSL